MTDVISPYLYKYANNKATGALVRVRYDNGSGGLYVEFLDGVQKGHHTWFQIADLTDYRKEQ